MNEILKQLEALLHRGYSSHEIFADLLDLILYALQGDDPHYLEIVRKYPNDKPIGHREIDVFQIAFQLILMEMKETNSEVLGELYMRWNMANKYKGQFFTPKHIASFMSQLINPQGRIFDPACGAGVMLVEAIKTMNNDSLNEALFFGQDIDMTCVKMTALNLCFFNVNGYVVQGDTLAVECNRVYQTRRSTLGGSIRELTGDDFDTFKSKYSPLVTNSIKEKPEQFVNLNKLNSEQLSLFGKEE